MEPPCAEGSCHTYKPSAQGIATGRRNPFFATVANGGAVYDTSVAGFAFDRSDIMGYIDIDRQRDREIVEDVGIVGA